MVGRTLALLALLLAESSAAQVEGTWSYPFGTGSTPNDRVLAAAVDRSGGLYIGGWFTSIGSVEAAKVAYWDGGTWHPLNRGIEGVWEVNALAVQADSIFVGGRGIFNYAELAVGLGSWDGNEWRYYGDGWSTVQAIHVHGNDVYIGGSFGSKVARWGGNAWLQLASGLLGEIEADYGSVSDLAGHGSDLYVAGSFKYTYSGDRNNPQGLRVNGIARWDGTAWHALGAGSAGAVFALAVDDAGRLYAAGDWDGVRAGWGNRVARWNGVGWEFLGGAFRGEVFVLAFLGDYLYAGGQGMGIDASGNLIHLFRWNGELWEAVPDGPNGYVEDLVPKGEGLVVVGGFTKVGTADMPYLAVWQPAESSNLARAGNARPLIAGLSVFPNPSVGSVAIEFDLSRPSSVSVELFDILGRRVEAAHGILGIAGSNRVELDVNDQAAGPLLLRLQLDGVHSAGIPIIRAR